MKSPCPGPDRLAQLAQAPEALPPAEQDSLREHLAGCKECRQVFSDLEDARDSQPVSLSEDEILTLLRMDRPEAHPFPTGIPGFEIVEVIRAGGHSVVYKARQLSLNRVVALKVLQHGSQPAPEARERFLNEIKILANINNPHFVTVHDSGQGEAGHWMALEYLPASLDRSWDGKPQPPDRVALLLAELAEAMQSAHEHAIVHRDLKPSNILLGADSTPRIADFGIAWLQKPPQADPAKKLTQVEAILGTPHYMAPEQIPGLKQTGPDCRTDVYGLGAILYEGLTGRAPFNGKTTDDILAQVRDRDPIPPTRLEPDVPRDLETICLKCLRKDAAGRYASARELADDLHRFRNGEPIRGRPETGFQRAARWCRKHPSLTGLGASLVAALVFAFAILTWAVWEARELAALEQRQKEQAKQEAVTQEQLRIEAEKREAVQEEGRLREVRRRADELAGTGDWRSARDVYTGLLAEPKLAPSERLAARLKVVRASMFLDDVDRAGQELAALDKEPLGDLAGTWRLEKAIYSLDRSIRRLFRDPVNGSANLAQDEAGAVALLKQVIEDEQTPLADRLTARGILAADARTASDFFEKALREQRFHPYAIPFAASVEMLSGQLEAALFRVEVWRRMNPRDPNPILHRGFILTLMKRDGAVRELLRDFDEGAPLHDRIDRKTLTAYRAILNITRAINRSLDNAMQLDRDFAVTYALNAPYAGGLGESGVFHIPFTPAQRQEYARLIGAVQQGYAPSLLSFPGQAGSVEDALAQLEHTKAFTPEGVRLFFHASFLLSAPYVAKHPERIAELKAEAGRDLEKALTAPNLFDIRRFCWMMLAGYKSGPHAMGEKEQLLREARDHLRHAAATGPWSESFATLLLELAKRAEDTALAGDVERFLKERKQRGK